MCVGRFFELKELAMTNVEYLPLFREVERAINLAQHTTWLLLRAKGYSITEIATMCHTPYSTVQYGLQKDLRFIDKELRGWDND